MNRKTEYASTNPPKPLSSYVRALKRELCVYAYLKFHPRIDKAVYVTAEDIRGNFVAPIRRELTNGTIFRADATLTLATWELAAQLAEFNNRFDRIDKAAKE